MPRCASLFAFEQVRRLVDDGGSGTLSSVVKRFTPQCNAVGTTWDNHSFFAMWHSGARTSAGSAVGCNGGGIKV